MPQSPENQLIEVPEHLRVKPTTSETAPSPHLIDVYQIPGHTEKVTVQALGGVGIEGGRLVPIAPEDVTPQMRANALGSPDMRDAAGRIVPKN